METKEFKFKGTVLNGFVMLFLVLALLFAAVVGIVFGIIQLDDSNGTNGVWLLVGSILLLVVGAQRGQSYHLVRQVFGNFRRNGLLLDKPLLWH